jgi:hypothetical protein
VSRFAPKGEPNVPEWSEDPKSPITQETSASKFDVTLSGSYDRVMLWMYIESPGDGTTGDPLRMRSEGNSQPYYNYEDTAGTTTTNANKWKLGATNTADTDEVYGATVVAHKTPGGSFRGEVTPTTKGSTTATQQIGHALSNKASLTDYTLFWDTATILGEVRASGMRRQTPRQTRRRTHRRWTSPTDNPTGG